METGRGRRAIPSKPNRNETNLVSEYNHLRVSVRGDHCDRQFYRFFNPGRKPTRLLL
jgi:hypothetical protein